MSLRRSIISCRNCLQSIPTANLLSRGSDQKGTASLSPEIFPDITSMSIQINIKYFTRARSSESFLKTSKLPTTLGIVY